MDGFLTKQDTSELATYTRYTYNGRVYALSSRKFRNVVHACLIEINRPDLTEFVWVGIGKIPHFEAQNQTLPKEDVALIEKAMYIHFQTLLRNFSCPICEAGFKKFGVSHSSGRDSRIL